jgi:hypothetical protein
MASTLAIIDVDIQSGRDEQAREALLGNLRGYCETCIQPLWVNLLRERADLRVVCLVRDVTLFDDFLIDVIRATPGVRSTSARLAFGGVVRAEVMTELPLQNSPHTRRAAATVFVKSEPGRDRETFKALLALPPHPEVQIGWILKVFHSPEADIKLLLFGDRTAALNAYVMSWVRTVPGVVDTRLTAVLDWQIIGKPEDFIELAESFPEDQAAR